LHGTTCQLVLISDGLCVSVCTVAAAGGDCDELSSDVSIKHVSCRVMVIVLMQCRMILHLVCCSQPETQI